MWDLLHPTKSKLFRKYIIFLLLTNCLCSRMEWLRGPDLARGS